jgi:ArsR family metal-binding transcriptional regulator
MDKQTWINGIRGFVQMAKNHLSEDEFDSFLDEVDDVVGEARPKEGDGSDDDEELEEDEE